MNRVRRGVATGAAICIPLALTLSACGSSPVEATAPTTANSVVPPPAATTTVPASTSAPTTVPEKKHKKKKRPSPGGDSKLPTGVENGFPFGSTNDAGTRISLLPPNDKDVDQALVTSAPKLGPFTISPTAGPKSWPSACTVTDLKQLEALIPSVTGLSGRPQGAKAEVLGGSGGKTPQDTDCKFNLKTTFDAAAAEPGEPSYVEITFEEIDPGSPSAYAQALSQQKASAKKFPAQYADYPNLENGVKCFSDGNELECIEGDAFYWIEGMKVTGGEHTSSDQAVWIDQAEIPLAEILGAELKT